MILLLWVLFSVSYKLIINSIILLGTCESLNSSYIPHVPVSLHTTQARTEGALLTTLYQHI